MTRGRVGVSLAAVLFAAPAAAYVRTTDKTTGKALFWPIPAVAWHLNRDWPNTSPTCAATAAGDPTLDAVRASFSAWEQPCADLRLVFGGTTGEIRTGFGGASEDIVVFRRGWCSQNPAATADPCFTDPDVDCGGIFDCFEDDCPAGTSSCTSWGIVALTSVLYDPNTGRIMDADIELNGWDGLDAGTVIGVPPSHGWYFTCVDPAGPPCARYGQDNCAFMDLQNTVTHEAGHFIGLAHPCGNAGLPSCTSPPPTGEVPYAERTMSPTTTVGEVTKRSLSADDIAGVCAIYPEPKGGCGCGSAGAGGTVALLVAALALRRRRAGP